MSNFAVTVFLTTNKRIDEPLYRRSLDTELKDKILKRIIKEIDKLEIHRQKMDQEKLE
ncbi:MAG: hypothetical protein ACFFD2_17725 [Promethearchaeota archaeon]